MRKKLAAMLLAAVMVVGLLPLSACSGGNTATTMHLRRTQGTVAISDGGGKDIPVLDNLSLYSGYGVGTQSASYAWIDLDDVKLTKLDQNSEISIEKEGKALEIELKSGALFFNVTEPLEDDETMNIRASTMLVGIRGTSGWVEERSGLSRVYILEGKVECSAGGRTVQVSAWEYAELTADGNLVVEPFTVEDIPAFVQDDADPDLIAGPDETPGPDATESPEPSESPEPPTGGDPSSPINLTISGGNYSNVDEPPVVWTEIFDWEAEDFREQQVSLDGCYVLSPEAQLTVSNFANADDSCYIDDILLWTLSEYDGTYGLDNLYFSHLTNNEGFIPHMMYSNPEYGDRLVQLRPGESVTFSISEYVTLYDDTGEAFLTYDLLVLAVYLYYPDVGQYGTTYTAYYGFVY